MNHYHYTASTNSLECNGETFGYIGSRNLKEGVPLPESKFRKVTQERGLFAPDTWHTIDKNEYCVRETRIALTDLEPAKELDAEVQEGESQTIIGKGDCQHPFTSMGTNGLRCATCGELVSAPVDKEEEKQQRLTDLYNYIESAARLHHLSMDEVIAYLERGKKGYTINKV